jgi:tetratricopeptide (TPR) repeat protein
MIERLLAAEAALEREDLDAAEKLFGQVAEVDARNAIAAVGLGRVAAGRDDAAAARAWFLKALEIDPDEAAARRLLAALDREVPPEPAVAPVEASASIPSSPSNAMPPEPAGAATAARAPGPGGKAPARRSLLDRLKAWFGLAGRRR